MQRFIQYVDYEEGVLRFTPLFDRAEYGLREERVRTDESHDAIVPHFLVCRYPGKDHEVILADSFDEAQANAILTRLVRLVARDGVTIIDVPRIVQAVERPAKAATEAAVEPKSCRCGGAVGDCRDHIKDVVS